MQSTALDSATLNNIFLASFSADPNTRIAAELELKRLEPLEGLVPSLLQLVSPSPSTTIPVRLASSIYLKNRITSSWRIPTSSSSTPSKYVAIPASDRQALKTNLLPLLSALCGDESSKAVKLQIGAVLGKVVDNDFPAEWPGLVDEVKQCLSGNEGSVEAGLLATVEILRGFRYTNRDPSNTLLPQLISTLFPTLLSISQTLLATPTPTAASLTSVSTLLHLTLKSYKLSIAHVLVPELQDQKTLVAWGSVFLGVVGRTVEPALYGDAEEDEKEKHEWTKCVKWAIWCLNRLFTRFGNPLSLSMRPTSSTPLISETPASDATSSAAMYGAFAERFTNQFAPEIMKAYFGLVERRVGGEWVGRKSTGGVLMFFEECIKPKSTWTLLKPHVLQLVEHFAFPLVCLTEDEIEQFTEDPAEFSRGHFGDFIEDSYTSPCATALAFTAALVETRKSSTLMLMLNLIQTIVSKYPAETTPKQKDGALRLLGSLAATATKSKKLAPMMESFFTQHVLPEFKSPHGFLRYRACEIVEKFESCDMEWGERQNLEIMFAAIMGAVTDPDLPVRIQAAIALPELVRYEEVRARMVPNIGRIMQELLKLANEVDLDALTNTTRSLVQEFQEEVIPFAVELTQSLMESYSRLVHESLEIRKKDEAGEEGYDGTYDEKTFVSINILKTVDQLIRSLEASPTSLDRIEVIVAPGLEFTVKNGMVELYDEVYEILDSISFFQKKVSPHLWPLFEATYTAFKNDASEYFNEMFGCIDNFVSFGADVFSTNAEYRRMLLDMFDTVMTSRALGAEDRVVACKLGEAMLLHLRGNIDEAIPPMVERCMTFVLSNGEDPDFIVTKSLYLHSLELIITAIFYNPALSLAILDRHDWTQRFFATWFKNLSKYSRVHDKKMSIGAICAIFEWLASTNGSAPLAQSASQLVVGALQVLKDFPASLAARAEYEESFARDEEEEEDEEFVDDDDEDFEGEDGDIVDSSDDYIDQLVRKELERNAREAADTDSEAGSTWSDEILWASPLDDLDVYKKFTETLTALEATQPALFQLATTPLTAEQRAALEKAAAIAMQGGEKSVQPTNSAIAQM
ncbi:hypothetical protein MNV49_002143 [Pseudohyphozyma bogoriensis]|nr:hypothetical protein MNV49_002143 [Pseudohyphozyma bogoriensis]